MILLSVCFVLTLVWAILVTVLAVKASRTIEKYEYFFRDTIVDIDHSREIFDQLVNRKEYLVDNPDIQKIQQVFGVTLNILEGYLDNGRQFGRTPKERKAQAPKKEEK